MALSKTTQDHDEIRQWAESRGAVPAEVASTESSGQTGILRIEFPKAKNANDSALKEISWDEFFEKFDASGLALVYQEQTAEGEQSNFNKLIYPEDSKDQPARKSSAKKTGTTKTPDAKAARKTKTPAKKTAAKNSAPAKSSKKAAPAKAAKKTPAKKAPAKSAAKKASTKQSSSKKAAGKGARSR